MSTTTTPKNNEDASNKSGDAVAFDLEKQQNDKNACKFVEHRENDEPLEKIKEKPPPGINASLVLFYAVCFGMFTLGWVNLNNCSISRLIPIYLIVTGFIGAVVKFLSKFENRYLFNVTLIFVAIYIIWHCLGTYWVYKEYQPNYDYKQGKYCDRTTFLFAFWALTLQYTVVGFTITLSGCYMLMKGDFKKK